MKDRFSVLFDYTTVPMCICNKEADILEVNAAFCEMLQCSEDELLGKNVIEDFTHPDDRQLSRDARADFYRINKRYVRKSGEILPIRLCVIRWKDTYLGTMESIQHELELRKKVMSMSDDLQRIAYSVSHDLSEPIRTISNYVDLLYEKCPSSNEDVYQTIEKSIKWIRKLIASLARYSKITRPDKITEVVNVVDILEEVEESLSSLISQKEVSINVVNTCPPVRGDEVHIFRLFQNLIHNAIKYSGPQVLIEIDCKKVGNFVQFSVKDNGIGIDPRYFSHIFQIFKRLHVDEDDGTGIGLSECKRIVDLYEGRIWVESKVGEGSTFYFTLPGGGREERIL